MYCEKWEESVHFYKYKMRLNITFISDWFIEFKLNEGSRLSVADQNRASTKSGPQKGITITLQVHDIYSIWNDVKKNGLQPTPIKKHPWDAFNFYVFDPEGHRIEIWESTKNANESV